MTKRILFLHSAGPQGPGEGSTRLVNYIRQSLSETHKLICPVMPHPEKPSYDAWKRQLERQLDIIDDEIILLGHSLGGSVLLKYFSEMPYQKPISGLFIIASPFWGEKNWKLDEYTLKENFAAHLISIPQIFLYHSSDDPIVPYEHTYRYAKSLPRATVTIVDHYGHNFEPPFPKLIRDIKEL